MRRPMVVTTQSVRIISWLRHEKSRANEKAATVNPRIKSSHVTLKDLGYISRNMNGAIISQLPRIKFPHIKRFIYQTPFTSHIFIIPFAWGHSKGLRQWIRENLKHPGAVFSVGDIELGFLQQRLWMRQSLRWRERMKSSFGKLRSNDAWNKECERFALANPCIARRAC